MKKNLFNLLVLFLSINAVAQKENVFFKRIQANNQQCQVIYMLMHQRKKSTSTAPARQLTGKAVYKYIQEGKTKIIDSACYKYSSAKRGASFDFNSLNFSVSYSPYACNIPKLYAMFDILCDTMTHWEWKGGDFTQCLAQYSQYDSANNLSAVVITNHRCISDTMLSEKITHIHNTDGTIGHSVITEQSRTKTDTVATVYYNYEKGRLLKAVIDTYNTGTCSWSTDYIFTYNYDDNGNITLISKWYCGVHPCLMRQYASTYYPDNRLKTVRNYDIDTAGKLSLNTLDSFGYTGKTAFSTYWICYERNLKGIVAPVEEIRKSLDENELPGKITVKSWVSGILHEQEMIINYSDNYPISITVYDSLNKHRVPSWYVSYYYKH